MYLEVQKLIKNYGFRVSLNYLKVKIETHPYYPSILCVKDVLEDLNFKVSVIRINENNLNQIGSAFLAHSKQESNENFIFFKNINDYAKKVSGSELNHTGVILTVVDTHELKSNDDNNNAVKNEKRLGAYKIIIGFCCFFFVVQKLYVSNFSIQLLTYIVSFLAGCYVCFLIIEKELGIANIFSDKICRLVKKEGCETILLSKGAKIFKWLSLGDIGLVYFFSSLVYIVIIPNYNLLVPIIFSSLLSIVFPFYSIYYQVKVIRSICILCIFVLLILLINFIVSLFQISIITGSSLNNTLISFLSYFFTVLGVLCVWLLLKDFIFKNDTLKIYNILYKRLKRNPDIFMSVTKWEEYVSGCEVKKNEILSFGSENADFKILIACNLFCNPCAIAHEMVDKLFNKYPAHVRVGIRFVLNENDLFTNTPKTIIVRHILQHILENPNNVQQILHFWYSNPVSEDLIKNYPVKVYSNVDNIMNEYITWNKKLKIRGTPTFWLNGNVLPTIFNWSDLFDQLPILIEDNLEMAN